MRVITLLAAALSFGAATAFPFVEEVPEKSLVRRTRQGHSGKSGHGGRRGGSRERKAPGTGGREGFNPNAPAHDQNRVHHSIQNSNQWHDNHYPYPSYEYSDKPRDQYGFGNSYMQTTRNTFGAPNFQFQMGSDRGPDHVAALMDREMRIPESSQAQYLPSSPHEMASRRHGPGGTLGGLPHHRHIDSNHEEKFAAGGKAINANYKDIGIVPATVYDTAGSTSRYQDSPAMKMGRRAAINDPNPYATFGVSANPSREFQQEFDRGEHPTFPLRAPKHPGLPDPVYSYDKDPQAAYGHSSGLTPRSSSNDDSRSNSPTRDSDRGHRIRDDRKHRHKKKSHGSRKHHKHDDGDRKHRKHDDGGRRRRHDKRDVVDRIGKHQSNSDSQSNEGQKTNTRQAYQELMEVSDALYHTITDLNLLNPKLVIRHRCMQCYGTYFTDALRDGQWLQQLPGLGCRLGDCQLGKSGYYDGWWPVLSRDALARLLGE